MKLLNLRDNARTLVYDLIVRALKSDPTLAATIHPDGWQTYTSEDDNDAPPGEDSLPRIRVTPFGQGASPESPISQFSPLGIQIDLATEGSDVRDLLNLWGAVEDALFPGDGSRTLGAAIRTALAADGRGAQYETTNLSAPAVTPSGPDIDKQLMLGSGTLNVMMRVRK